MVAENNSNPRYKHFFEHNADNNEDRREMLKVIQKAQRLLAMFLNVTNDCPRCIQKLEERLR